MRADIFQYKKCVHLKLDKEVHSALRAKLFEHGVSMQDTFDEFARHLVEGKKSATIILESLIRKKLREEIDGKLRKKRNEKFGELDSEALYSLIEIDEKEIVDETNVEENK